MAGGAPVQIALEDDPTPLVRILGAILPRSARNPALQSKLGSMRGVVALKSSVDPQAVTIRFDKGSVTLEHGVAADSGVVIEADLTRMNEPDAPKPKVRGAARHLKLALAVSKVLDPPAGTVAGRGPRLLGVRARPPAHAEDAARRLHRRRLPGSRSATGRPSTSSTAAPAR